MQPLRRAALRFWHWLQRVVPFGLLVATKPRHYREMLRVLWRNRGRWRYAMRILRHGVCDGCSLGPRGLRDDVIPGVHLCLTRLGLLELNTMRAIPDGALGDIRKLRAMSNEELHRLGRVPYPLLRRRGDPGFRAHLVGRGVAHRRRVDGADRRRSHGLLRQLARAHQRGLLLDPEARAHRRHGQRRQLRAAVPRGVGVGLEDDHRLGRADLLAVAT